MIIRIMVMNFDKKIDAWIFIAKDTAVGYGWCDEMVVLLPALLRDACQSRTPSKHRDDVCR
jgi:hypothetical protein